MQRSSLEAHTVPVLNSALEAALRDEHPSVVLHDLLGRRLPDTHLIVFANEKGGVGKSTLSFQTALALAHQGRQVLAIDCDRRQQTLHRLLEARDGTGRTLKVDFPRVKHLVLEKQSAALLIQEIDRLGHDCDVVIIDLAGHDSPIARRAIALAHTVVTPVNCSPADVDALGSINPISGQLRKAAPFAELVVSLRAERIVSGLEPFDWIVAKNRVRRCEHRLIASTDRSLSTMARDLGFRMINGLTELVAYRELLSFGLSHLDLKLIRGVGRPRSAHAHELQQLVAALHIPEAKRLPSERRRERAGRRAPVSPRVAECYHEALRAALQKG